MESNNNSDIKILLTKFLQGELTVVEKQNLFSLISSAENESSFKAILFSLLNESAEEHKSRDTVDFDFIYRNILSELKRRKVINDELSKFKRKHRIRIFLIRGVSVAAVFAIVFFLGNFFSLTKKSNSSEPVAPVSYTEIKAPFGSKSEVSMPDGTHVMLNAGSKLRYRSDFNLSNRDVTLVGEAYFNVAKNIDLPLFVSAGNLSIKAVGTEFNIKAYEDEEIIETTLLEGKIEITQLGQTEGDNKLIDLNPNQKAIYTRETESFALSEVSDSNLSVTKPVNTIYNKTLISPKADVDQVVAWTKGKLIIRGENLYNLSIELQRKYDVTFIFGDEEIKKFRFTGVLLDETLEQVLSVIKLTAPIKYYLKGKTVFLSSDKEHLNDFSKYLK